MSDVAARHPTPPACDVYPADRQHAAWQVVSLQPGKASVPVSACDVASYRSRHVESTIADALSDTKVVIVNGARQSGKSTAVHHLVRNIGNTREHRLDRPNDLVAARLLSSSTTTAAWSASR
jgi:hypothetical protein